MIRVLFVLSLAALPLTSRADLNTELQQRNQLARDRAAAEEVERRARINALVRNNDYNAVRAFVRSHGGQVEGATCEVMPDTQDGYQRSYYDRQTTTIALASYGPQIGAGLSSCTIRIAGNKICVVRATYANREENDYSRSLIGSCTDQDGNNTRVDQLPARQPVQKKVQNGHRAHR